MKQVTAKKSQNRSIWLPLIWGITAALLTSIFGAFLGTLLINAGSVQENAYPVITIATWFLSTMIGSFVACKHAAQQYLVISVLTVIGYLLFLIALQILLFNSQFDQIWKGIVVSFAGIIPSILICGRTKGRHKAKFKYRPA